MAAATDAIQGERTLSAALRAGAGPEVARALDDQRAITDAGRRACRSPRSPTLAARARRAASEPAAAAIASSSGSPQVRAETDTAVSEVPWKDPFAPVIESLLEVQEAAASVTADLGVGEGLASVALVAG